MKREALKELGLTDEQIDKVMAENGKDIEAQKAKTTAAETEAKVAKDQLVEANKQIDGFKAMPKVEDIQKAADEYKTKFEQAQKDAAIQVNTLKFDHALDAALTSAKAKDPVSVRAHLKTDAMKLNEDGTILGLTEQLDKLKTDHEYLFESSEETPKIVTSTKNNNLAADAIISAAREGAGLPNKMEK